VGKNSNEIFFADKLPGDHFFYPEFILCAGYRIHKKNQFFRHAA
jgi:hypothetical protein